MPIENLTDFQQDTARYLLMTIKHNFADYNWVLLEFNGPVVVIKNLAANVNCKTTNQT